jgi:hypothetical protein
MSIIDWIILLIAVILIFQIVRKSLPVIRLLYQPVRVSCQFIEMSENNTGVIEHDGIQDLANNLESIDFTFIGIKSEQLNLPIDPVQEVSFASHKKKSFVSILTRGKKVVYYFYTPFTDGSIVLTANTSFAEREADKFSIKTVKSANLADLINVHQERVQAFINVGSEPFQKYTQETRLRATELFYASEGSRKYMQSIGLRSLLSAIGSILILGLSAWFLMSIF